MKKVPKFKPDKEAAIFLQTHIFEDYFKDTVEPELTFVKKTKNRSP